MDINMPVMNGIQCTELICQHVRSNKLDLIPIIICTALDSENIIQRAFTVGAVDYLVKPISYNTLKITLEKHQMHCGTEELKYSISLSNMDQ